MFGIFVFVCPYKLIAMNTIRTFFITTNLTETHPSKIAIIRIMRTLDMDLKITSSTSISTIFPSCIRINNNSTRLTGKSTTFWSHTPRVIVVRSCERYNIANTRNSIATSFCWLWFRLWLWWFWFCIDLN